MVSICGSVMDVSGQVLFLDTYVSGNFLQSLELVHPTSRFVSVLLG